MEIIPFIIVTWLIQASIALVLSAPVIYFSRKRIHWRRSELAVLIIPFLVWLVLGGVIGFLPKSLANAFIEPVIISITVPMVALIRVAVGTRISEKMCSASLIGVVTVVAVSVYFIVPCLPEQ